MAYMQCIHVTEQLLDRSSIAVVLPTEVYILDATV